MVVKLIYHKPVLVRVNLWMFLTLAIPDDGGFLLDLINLPSGDGIKRNVYDQDDWYRKININSLDNSIVLHPTTFDSHHWPIIFGNKLERVDKINEAGDNDRNSEGIKAVEQEPSALATATTNATTECWPNVVAPEGLNSLNLWQQYVAINLHHVKPEEAEKHTNVYHISGDDTRQTLGHEHFFFKLHDGQSDVQDC